ncbi:hypothetical protein KGF57_000765 [Candida theae]|uniref:Uncharacterized protein n=1 Tax=Candida theae TaxID=1198502 RepID=A0AAD5BID1_9ASCO|nr:uncharacterized protein KGF57_000765 [Candida theae]KAI5965499.1 hypothetical protein KGF57_000765 [Candida theae]
MHSLHLPKEKKTLTSGLKLRLRLRLRLRLNKYFESNVYTSGGRFDPHRHILKTQMSRSIKAFLAKIVNSFRLNDNYRSCNVKFMTSSNEGCILSRNFLDSYYSNQFKSSRIIVTRHSVDKMKMFTIMTSSKPVPVANATNQLVPDHSKSETNDDHHHHQHHHPNHHHEHHEHHHEHQHPNHHHQHPNHHHHHHQDQNHHVNNEIQNEKVSKQHITLNLETENNEVHVDDSVPMETKEDRSSQLVDKSVSEYANSAEIGRQKEDNSQVDPLVRELDELFAYFEAEAGWSGRVPDEADLNAVEVDEDDSPIAPLRIRRREPVAPVAPVEDDTPITPLRIKKHKPVAPVEAIEKAGPIAPSELTDSEAFEAISEAPLSVARSPVHKIVELAVPEVTDSVDMTEKKSPPELEKSEGEQHLKSVDNNNNNNNNSNENENVADCKETCLAPPETVPVASDLKPKAKWKARLSQKWSKIGSAMKSKVEDKQTANCETRGTDNSEKPPFKDKLRSLFGKKRMRFETTGEVVVLFDADDYKDEDQELFVVDDEAEECCTATNTTRVDDPGANSNSGAIELPIENRDSNEVTGTVVEGNNENAQHEVEASPSVSTCSKAELELKAVKEELALTKEILELTRQELRLTREDLELTRIKAEAVGSETKPACLERQAAAPGSEAAAPESEIPELITVPPPPRPATQDIPMKGKNARLKRIWSKVKKPFKKRARVADATVNAQDCDDDLLSPYAGHELNHPHSEHAMISPAIDTAEAGCENEGATADVSDVCKKGKRKGRKKRKRTDKPGEEEMPAESGSASEFEEIDLSEPQTGNSQLGNNGTGVQDTGQEWRTKHIDTPCEVDESSSVAWLFERTAPAPERYERRVWMMDSERGCISVDDDEVEQAEFIGPT